MDSRIRLVRQPNEGTAAARNRGFAEISQTTKYISFLDHDDLWETDTLETLSGALAERPQATAASGLSRCVDADSRTINEGELENWGRDRMGVSGLRLVRWPQNQPTSLAVLAYRNCILSPGQVLIRRSALEAVGPFDPAASPCDDWDMWLRLSQRGDIVYLDRTILRWRAHDGNTSADSKRMISQQRFVRAKLLMSAHLSAEQRHIVLTANSYWGRQLYAMRLREALGCIARGQLRRAAWQLLHAVRSYARCTRGLAAH
jgi:GT2 family glycosyltransferase